VWIIFLFSFSSLDKDWKYIKKESFYSVIFYLILLIPFSFSLFWVNKSIIFLIIVFILGDFLFRILSNIPIFSEKKINIRYFWLILNYVSTLTSLLYIVFINFSYYAILICLFNIIFNYQVHKKYWNYVSLFLSILVIIVLFLYLFLKLKDLYVSLI
jgi:hypothetical protein